MRADQGERIAQADRQGRSSTQTVLTAVAVLLLAGAAYLLAPGGEDTAPEPEEAVAQSTATPPVPPQPMPAPAIEAAPDIPEAYLEEPEVPAEPEAVEENLEDPEPIVAPEPTPPPTPEELDARLRTGIAEAGLSVDEALASALSAPYLLDRSVSSLDQVARGLVPRRTLNLPTLRSRYPTRNEGQSYRVDPAGYARYDTIVAAATSIPPDTIAGLFRRYRSELEDAYAALGYPGDAIDNALIAALDAVLAVPVQETPPLLRSKGALWAYTDPELEAASDLQKQIMRSGPDNTRALKAWARELRSALLNP